MKSARRKKMLAKILEQNKIRKNADMAIQTPAPTMDPSLLDPTIFDPSLIESTPEDISDYGIQFAENEFNKILAEVVPEMVDIALPDININSSNSD